MTKHKIIIGDAKENSKYIKDKSINLIITSPPYPMISMWDEIFNELNNNITKKLINDEPEIAFDLMHKEIEKIYDAFLPKLNDEAIVCINIGDATRKSKGFFAIYPNSARTINYFLSKGFHQLPSIIWNKPTNSPNKFLGSGTLPCGAYNTLEHEHILIFRKRKRSFNTIEEKNNRNHSAFFWTERNLWCNNLWSVLGTRQKNNNTSRERNGAFPLEIPYRLISLWTVKNDTIIDIFGGTGTSSLAAIGLERNSIIFELKKEFKKDIEKRIFSSIDLINKKNKNRIIEYKNYLKDKNKNPKYINDILGIPVISKQEEKISIPEISNIKLNDNSENHSTIICDYKN